MPEIIISGLRDVGNGASESQHKMLEEMREQRQIQMWTLAGSEQECKDSWRDFLLQGTPDWVIYTNELSE